MSYAKMAERILPYAAKKNPLQLAAQVGECINSSLLAADMLESLAALPSLQRMHPGLCAEALACAGSVQAATTAFFMGGKKP